jgi:hypothetical protein
MKPSIKIIAFVLMPLWLWIGLSACNQVSVAGLSATQTVPPLQATSTPTKRPWSTYTNLLYQVTFQYPADWQYVEGDQTAEKYSGRDGYFRVGGMSGGGMSLDEVTQSEAFHVLHPFGTQPTIENLELKGQQARLILPSRDQSETSPDMAGASELIVQYPRPVTINDISTDFLVLSADTDHIRTFAESLTFLLSQKSSTQFTVVNWQMKPFRKANPIFPSF